MPPAPAPGLDRVGLGAGLGAAAVFGLAVLCCAGPALLAAGALGALGGWLADPWLIGAAVVLIAAAVAWALRRRTTHTPDGGGGEGGGGEGGEGFTPPGCPPVSPPRSPPGSRRPVHTEPAPIQYPER